MSNFTVGQQVKVVANHVDAFISAMAGEERNSHAIAIGEVVTVLAISNDTDEIKVDVTGATLEHPDANPFFQWVDEHHIEAV